MRKKNAIKFKGLFFRNFTRHPFPDAQVSVAVHNDMLTYKKIQTEVDKIADLISLHYVVIEREKI
jgi:hypothetical protein